MPRPKVKETHLLIVKHQSEGQASNLAHISRSVLEHSPRVETWGGVLSSHFLCHAPEHWCFLWELLQASGALVLVAAAEATPLAHLVLGNRGACAPGHMGL